MILQKNIRSPNDKVEPMEVCVWRDVCVLGIPIENKIIFNNFIQLFVIKRYLLSTVVSIRMLIDKPFSIV
jgi:hypothetical protein